MFFIIRQEKPCYIINALCVPRVLKNLTTRPQRVINFIEQQKEGGKSLPFYLVKETGKTLEVLKTFNVFIMLSELPVHVLL